MGNRISTFTCRICFNILTATKQSDHSYCDNCMSKYIQTKLEKNVSKIKCPFIICDHFLEPLSWRPILNHRVFNKWCDVLCESTLSTVDSVYCPYKECSELILNECGDNNLKRCVCPCCRKPFCFGCKVPWHDGYTCEQSGVTKDENDVAFDIVRETKGWKRCPKCRHCVERVDGCNRISCRCGTRFCYKCGKEACACVPHLLESIGTLLLWYGLIAIIIYFLCKS